MKLGRFYTLGIAALLLPALVLAEPTRGTSRLGRVVTETHYPMPSDSQLDQWTREFFETDEIWLFENRSAFEDMVDASRAPPSLKQRLKRLFRPIPLSGADARDILTSIETTMQLPAEADRFADIGGIAQLSDEVRSEVPRDLLEKVYRHQAHRLGITHEYVAPLSLLNNELKAAGASGLARMELLKNTVQIGQNSDPILPLTRHSWNLLPDSFRRKVVESLLQKQVVREGVRATLIVKKSDDIAAIAAKYAGERDPRPIERYIRRLLGNSNSVKIPLENILHPFIRRMINRYSTCHGPNCFNTGPNVNRSAIKEAQPRKRAPIVIEKTYDGDLITEAYMRYRFVKPEESLRTGDLMIYRNPSGDIEHVATYIGDNLVFTKNGLNRVSPYILQDIGLNEAAYPDAVRLSVYRTPAKGEDVISKSGKLRTPEVVYRQRRAIPPQRVIDDFFTAEGQRQFDLSIGCIRNSLIEYMH